MDIIHSWCSAHNFAIVSTNNGWVDLQRTSAPNCAICCEPHGAARSYAIADVDTVRAQCEVDGAICGTAILWSRTDFRADFVDPMARWEFADIEVMPRDLTTDTAIACFRKFAQQTLAYITRYNCYIARAHVRDSISFIPIEPVCNADAWMLADGTSVTLSRALELFARDSISWDNVCFMPYLRAIPQLDARLLNLWLGFDRANAQPREDSVVNQFAKYVCEYLCNGVSRLYTYFMDWFADLVQFPAREHRTSLVINAPEECQNLLEMLARELVGRNYFARGDVARDALTMKLCVFIRAPFVTVMQKIAEIDRSATTFARFIIVTDRACPIHSRESYCAFNHVRGGTKESNHYARELMESMRRNDAMQAIFEDFARRNIARFDCANIPLANIYLRSDAPITSVQKFMCSIALHRFAEFDSTCTIEVPVDVFYSNYCERVTRKRKPEIPAPIEEFIAQISEIIGEPDSTRKVFVFENYTLRRALLL